MRAERTATLGQCSSAGRLRVPSGRFIDILNGKRSVAAEIALRLGRQFGNALQFWINLQAPYDLAVAMRGVGRSNFLQRWSPRPAK